MKRIKFEPAYTVVNNPIYDLSFKVKLHDQETFFVFFQYFFMAFNRSPPDVCPKRLVNFFADKKGRCRVGTGMLEPRIQVGKFKLYLASSADRR
jgi:hypothetical protein